MNVFVPLLILGGLILVWALLMQLQNWLGKKTGSSWWYPAWALVGLMVLILGTALQSAGSAIDTSPPVQQPCKIMRTC